MQLKIEKRSGRVEDFNEDKIVRSITRAGAKLAIAKEILGVVKQRLEQERVPLVKTGTLKQYIRDELDRSNPNVSKTYWEYVKPTRMMKTKREKTIGHSEAGILSKKTAQYDKPK